MCPHARLPRPTAARLTARKRPREADHPSDQTADRREYSDTRACGHGDGGETAAVKRDAERRTSSVSAIKADRSEMMW